PPVPSGFLFRPGRGRVGSDRCAIHDEPFVVLVPECRGDLPPDALAAPAVVPLPEAAEVPGAAGQVPPGDAGPGEVADGVDEPPVVPGGAAAVGAGPAGQQVFDLGPILIADVVAAEHGLPSPRVSCQAAFPYHPISVNT